MDFTGERFVPGVTGDIELEHLHRYLLAQDLCAGKTVLDIASGEGYGAALLAAVATEVIGVDVDPEAVAHAQRRYERNNLTFRVGDCAAIPLPDDCCDVVVSFETIEHHDRHEEMLAEIRRVLRPGGVLVISSPDKEHYSCEPGFKNEYHVKELFEHEFKALLERNFRHVVYHAQRVAYGSVILPETGLAQAVNFWKDKETVRKSPGLARPIFWLALAADDPPPALAGGLFEQPIMEAESVRLIRRDLQGAVEMLRQKDEHLAHAAEMLAAKDEHLAHAAEMLAAKDEHLAHAAKLLDEKDEQLRRSQNPGYALSVWFTRSLGGLWQRHEKK